MLPSPRQPTELNYHMHLGHSKSPRSPLDPLGPCTGWNEKGKTDQPPRGRSERVRSGVPGSTHGDGPSAEPSAHARPVPFPPV